MSKKKVRKKESGDVSSSKGGKGMNSKNRENGDQTNFPLGEIPRSTVLGPMIDLSPATVAQASVFQNWAQGLNIVMSGQAGCGKTFIALGLALKDVIASNFKKKLTIVRTMVPTRDMGFLPGTAEEKIEPYIAPYQDMVQELFRGDRDAWDKLVKKGGIEFRTTSFIRGITIRGGIVLIDELQNYYGRELDSSITRLGQNTRVIICGDYDQSDFDKMGEKKGAREFLKIIDQMAYFHHVEFGWEDCVRSGLVRDYLMTKAMLKISF